MMYTHYKKLKEFLMTIKNGHDIVLGEEKQNIRLFIQSSISYQLVKTKRNLNTKYKKNPTQIKILTIFISDIWYHG